MIRTLTAGTLSALLILLIFSSCAGDPSTTGSSVVGNMGSDLRFDYSVLGDTVNLASRLCGAAPADGIMMSESTAEFPGVASMVDLHQQPALKIRGRKTLVKPSIAGTPSREFGQWLMQTMTHILNTHTE